MKRFYPLLTFGLLLLYGCNSDTDDVDAKVNATLTFSHYWDQTSITNSEFNTLNFTNDHGELMSIERLRYLISVKTLQNLAETSSANPLSEQS